MTLRFVAPIVSVVFVLGFQMLASAQDPEAPVFRNISFQGYLTNSVGVPLDTTVGMQLQTYDDFTGNPAVASFSGNVDAVNGRFGVPIRLYEADGTRVLPRVW